MQFLVLFRRKWPLTLLYRPPFILKLETPTFFGHHFFISFFLFHFPVHFIVFIVYSILPFSFLLFSHTKKDQVHKREKKKKKKKKSQTTTCGPCNPHPLGCTHRQLTHPHHTGSHQAGSHSDPSGPSVHSLARPFQPPPPPACAAQSPQHTHPQHLRVPKQRTTQSMWR